ncbi:hypothetical protein U9M48_029995 [Paspalum notatum var. saurae]|uniref:Reverse transcriptase domain-containing protein n=1 Tax=Paspalum notatum var. saurae TaxID=547442 RepID=A0AAQ3X270_PASNO
MVDMLKVFISRAKLDGRFVGVIPHLVDGRLSILHYADDTILFMDHDPDKARNKKLLLFAFEQASDLKINFHKKNKEIAIRLKLKNALRRDLVARKGDENKKYGLAKWSILCQPKYQGGLGILNLNTKNSPLLSKWLYKLLTSDRMWQQILRNKYIGSKPLAQVEWKIGVSNFWSCLMKVKLDFLCFGTFFVKDGSHVRFWKDN